jgi:adenylate cyclase
LSDLRGFTERSDRLEGTQVIVMLNALFDAQAKAIVGHDGEILKFMVTGCFPFFQSSLPTRLAPPRGTRLQQRQKRSKPCVDLRMIPYS